MSALQEKDNLQREFHEISQLHELNQAEGDSSIELELRTRLQRLKAKLNTPESPSEETALLTVRAGTGGLEAQAWAQMLAGMYVSWANRTGRTPETIDHSPGTRDGLRTATIQIEGAHPLLTTEQGAHRLLRVSPYDKEDRKQTSMASVEVLRAPAPESPTEILQSDLRIQAFQAGGHGGQHVNKVATAVRITHLPTGTVATCRTERSQLQNKQNAMRLLAARVQQKIKDERDVEAARARGERPIATWGHRVRSYYLHSRRQVIDHRTGVRAESADQVLSGHIEVFINHKDG